ADGAALVEHAPVGALVPARSARRPPGPEHGEHPVHLGALGLGEPGDVPVAQDLGAAGGGGRGLAVLLALGALRVGGGVPGDGGDGGRGGGGLGAAEVRLEAAVVAGQVVGALAEREAVRPVDVAG